MHEFWYGYVKPKYHENTDDIYKDIAEDVETSFDTSNCQLYRLLLKVKYLKKWINERLIIKNEVLGGKELGGKIMTLFGLRAKPYSYLINDGCEDKRAKGTKKCFIKRKLKFENENGLSTKKIKLTYTVLN